MLNEMEKMNRILKRRRRRRLLRFAFLSVFLAAAGAVLINFFFIISVISIDNNTRYDSIELLEGCNLNIGNGLFTFNRDSLKKSITIEYPYVKSMDIKIRLPDKLEVKVLSTEPYIAIKLDDSNYLYLDSDLKVLEKTTNYNIVPNLLIIVGLDITEYDIGLPLNEDINIEVDTVKNIIASLKEYNLVDGLTLLDFTKKYNLYFILEDRINVEIGNGEDLDKKINLLVNIMERNKNYEKMVINVRNYKEGRCRIIE